jgi:hypothetical protein
MCHYREIQTPVCSEPAYICYKDFKAMLAVENEMWEIKKAQRGRTVVKILQQLL